MSAQEQRPIGTGFDASSDVVDVLDGVDLTGKTALVTGGSSGLGAESVKALAAAGARVIAPVRRPGSAPTAEEVEEVSGLDLGDLDTVARAAEHIAEITSNVNIVITAAGVMATPLRRVGPGWEGQLAVNHLGHFALLARLYPLLAAQGARVVTYSSSAHHASGIRWDDPHFLRGYDKWKAYGQSKTATSLFAVGLDARGRGDGVRAFTVHPGKILTGLQRDVPHAEQVAMGWVDEQGKFIGEGFKTWSQGAATGLWAATAGELEGQGGLFLEDCDVAAVLESGGAMTGGVEPYAVDHAGAEKLWRISAAITATDLPG
ncbi:oxidoreductase [Brevibacterium sp. 'Marine']|uniref:oxidoreductase n=1 Tax=Brevibacterium sp. 'Marine' TaxID=2725563 RepID=UPI00145EA589|nr:oxidoreductase [Brevibacterium sp. 'Marine']